MHEMVSDDSSSAPDTDDAASHFSAADRKEMSRALDMMPGATCAIVSGSSQAKDEPVFLEVIPQDVVTIHPDLLSQTVGLFDGQQPVAAAVNTEQQERIEEQEPVKEWEWWPSELQESRIKFKPAVQGKYGRELAVAVQAVQLACMLSQRVQERLLRDEEKAKSKKDKSLVTVAGTFPLCFINL